MMKGRLAKFGDFEPATILKLAPDRLEVKYSFKWPDTA
jgi:hypothetical protein